MTRAELEAMPLSELKLLAGRSMGMTGVNRYTEKNRNHLEALMLQKTGGEEFIDVMDIICGPSSLHSPEAVAADIIEHFRRAT